MNHKVKSITCVQSEYEITLARQEYQGKRFPGSHSHDVSFSGVFRNNLTMFRC